MQDQWFCQVFDTEMGPLSWSELCEMAAHGALKPRQRVRRQGDAAWREAREIEGLMPAPAAAMHDETDFEVTSKPSPPTKAPPTKAAPPADDADFEITVPPPKKSDPKKTDTETDFEIAAVPKRQVKQPAQAAEDTDFDIAAPAPSKSNDETDFEIGAVPERRTPDRPKGK
jgi:hypothetical protein